MKIVAVFVTLRYFRVISSFILHRFITMNVPWKNKQTNKQQKLSFAVLFVSADQKSKLLFAFVYIFAQFLIVVLNSWTQSLYLYIISDTEEFWGKIRGILIKIQNWVEVRRWWVNIFHILFTSSSVQLLHFFWVYVRSSVGPLISWLIITDLIIYTLTKIKLIIVAPYALAYNSSPTLITKMTG